jgi:hypothetical protein
MQQPQSRFGPTVIAAGGFSSQGPELLQQVSEILEWPFEL